MTIFFASETFLSRRSLNAGDYWCIYFKAGSSPPWFGYINTPAMECVQNEFVGMLDVEPDEISVFTTDPDQLIRPLEYWIDDNDYKIPNIEPLQLK